MSDRAGLGGSECGNDATRTDRKNAPSVATACEVHGMTEPCENCRRYLPLRVDGVLRIYDLDNPDDRVALYRLHQRNEAMRHA